MQVTKKTVFTTTPTSFLPEHNLGELDLSSSCRRLLSSKTGCWDPWPRLGLYYQVSPHWSLKDLRPLLASVG